MQKLKKNHSDFFLIFWVMIVPFDRKSSEDHESPNFYVSTILSFWVIAILKLIFLDLYFFWKIFGFQFSNFWANFFLNACFWTRITMSKTSSKWKWLSLKVSIFTPIFTGKLIEIQLICHNFQTKPLSLRWCFVYCNPRPKTHI